MSKKRNYNHQSYKLVLMINYIIIPKKSKIDIFNVMIKEELDEELNNSENTHRDYQRIDAMKFISLGIPHNLVAECPGVTYRTINK